MTDMTMLPARRLTVTDLYDLPDDGMHDELVDGALLVTPLPVLRHEHAVAQLTGLLIRAMPEQWCVLGDGLRFDDRNDRVPDGQVVRLAALARTSPHPATCSRSR